MYNNWTEKVIELKNKNKLTEENIEKLKGKHNSNDVELVVACVNNNIDKLKEFIKNGYDLSICNDSILRFTVSEGYVDISMLLLKSGVDVR